MTASYFVRSGPASFRATELTSGAWSTTEQHIAPMYGLVTHILERFAHSQDNGLVLSRLAIEILGVIAIDEVEITVEVVRPGRTIELLEATVTQAGRAVVRARAWWLSPSDTAEVAGGAAGPLPHPDTCQPLDAFQRWPGDFIKTLQGRVVRTPEPGRATVWLRSNTPLLPNEPVSTLATYLSLIDTANGVAVREDPRRWMFPNVDATISLHRQPVGQDDGCWVGLDTSVVFGAGGVGLTSTVLHDISGEVGRLHQTLTVRRLG